MTQYRAYQDRIVSDPKIMAGKAVVKGTRIPVERVLQHLAENPDLSDLFAAFPHLSIDDVKACLAFAATTLEEARQQATRTGAASPHSARP